MIVSYRHAYPRTLAIDTGDVLWVEPEDLRNDYVLKGYAQIGYDAIVLGDQEWGALPRRLKALLEANKRRIFRRASTVPTPGCNCPSSRNLAGFRRRLEGRVLEPGLAGFADAAGRGKDQPAEIPAR